MDCEPADGDGGAVQGALVPAGDEGAEGLDGADCEVLCGDGGIGGGVGAVEVGGEELGGGGETGDEPGRHEGDFWGLWGARGAFLWRDLYLGGGRRRTF